MTDLVIGNNATRQMSERTCFFLCFSFFIIYGIVSKVYSSIPPAALSSLHSPVTSNHHFCVFLFFFGWFHMIDSTMCNCFGNKSQEFTRTHTRLEKKEKKRKKKSIKKKQSFCKFTSQLSAFQSLGWIESFLPVFKEAQFVKLQGVAWFVLVR